MPFVDLIDKGVAWARKICQMFEAMCLEVDEFMHKHAEQAKNNQGMAPAPTSDEVGGCKSFRKARESSNLVNASTVHPSSAVPSPSSFTGQESYEHEAGSENPSACRTVPAIELSEDGFEACNKFAEPELSVSLPENGKSDDKPWMATVQASEHAKLERTYIAVNKNKVSSNCKAANHCHCKLQVSEIPQTRLGRGEDKKLQAGDVEAGSNQQKGYDLWASEWVIV